MSKHTKGPWQVIGARPDRAIIGNKRSIARVWGAIQPDDRPDHPEADANAHLIAAAPDLLEALEAIVTHYPLIHGEPVPAWIRNGGLAIAKAKGKDQ